MGSWDPPIGGMRSLDKFPPSGAFVIVRSRYAVAVMAALVSGMALMAPVRVRAQSLSDFLRGSINSAKKSVVRGVIGGILNGQLPLKLDANTSYSVVASPPGGPFLPKLLQPSDYPNIEKPLRPGDYVIKVFAYCTEYSAHLPGNGFAYRLAPLQGKATAAIANLLARGSLQGVPAPRLEAITWAIESGITYQEMPDSYKTLINLLIPDYKDQIEGDFVRQIQDDYQRYSHLVSLPSLDSLLGGMGPAGQFTLGAERVRSALLEQNTSDEVKTQTLFAGAQTGVYYPVVADQGPWTIRVPGLAYMKYIIKRGNLVDDNLMQIRIVRQANLPESAYPSLAQLMGLFVSTTGRISSSGMIGYSMGKPAQALIPELPPGYAYPKTPIGGGVLPPTSELTVNYVEPQPTTVSFVVDLPSSPMVTLPHNVTPGRSMPLPQTVTYTEKCAEPTLCQNLTAKIIVQFYNSNSIALATPTTMQMNAAQTSIDATGIQISPLAAKLIRGPQLVQPKKVVDVTYSVPAPQWHAFEAPSGIASVLNGIKSGSQKVGLIDTSMKTLGAISAVPKSMSGEANAVGKASDFLSVIQSILSLDNVLGSRFTYAVTYSLQFSDASTTHQVSAVAQPQQFDGLALFVTRNIEGLEDAWSGPFGGLLNYISATTCLGAHDFCMMYEDPAADINWATTTASTPLTCWEGTTKCGSRI